ncbi:hypothetical protein ACRX5L_13175 [Staphylococcus ureilyticus]
MFEGDYSSVIENTPDFDLKIGENATLAIAYLQKDNISKAKNVIQTDMYQSLMTFMHEYSLMISHDLHSVSIETLELKFYHLNKAFNVDYLFPAISLNCYYQFALFYARKSNDIAIYHLKKYCHCFDYLVSEFVYQKDNLFNGIDEWLDTLPLGERLPANYENTLNVMYSIVSENEHFNTLENFEYIKKDLLRIYNKKDEPN